MQWRERALALLRERSSGECLALMSFRSLQRAGQRKEIVIVSFPRRPLAETYSKIQKRLIRFQKRQRIGRR